MKKVLTNFTFGFIINIEKNICSFAVKNKLLRQSKTMTKETADVDEKKSLIRRSETLYSEYLDVLYSAKMIEDYFKPKPKVSISRKDT